MSWQHYIMCTAYVGGKGGIRLADKCTTIAVRAFAVAAADITSCSFSFDNRQIVWHHGDAPSLKLIQKCVPFLSVTRIHRSIVHHFIYAAATTGSVSFPSSRFPCARARSHQWLTTRVRLPFPRHVRQQSHKKKMYPTV